VTNCYDLESFNNMKTDVSLDNLQNLQYSIRNLIIFDKKINDFHKSMFMSIVFTIFGPVNINSNKYFRKICLLEHFKQFLQ